MNLSKTKVLVFDLDGTLYEDTHHFDYQAARLKEKLPANKQDLFEKDYLAAKKGEHPLIIGRIYDVKNDLILVQLDNIVKEAYQWNGNQLSQEEIAKLYQNKIELDFEKMLSVGDPWWISMSIAAHYGMEYKVSYQAFLETREYMMGPQFVMKPIQGFQAALQTVQEKKELVLLTNSPKPDSEAILQKLGLQDIFSLKIFNGEKPTKTVERFEQIKAHFQVSYEEIVSIGDNWINEIRPAKALGCSTIFIDAHGLGDETFADLVVKRMSDVIPYLVNAN